MKFNILPTNTIYRRIIAEPDMAKKEALYMDGLLQPFAGLFKTFEGMMPGMSWMEQMKFTGCYVPETLTSVPELLEKLEANNAWQETAAALEEGAARFAPYTDRIGVNEITFGLFLGERSDPMTRGYGGMGAITGYIMVTISEASDYVLSKLRGLTIHELHHNILYSFTPWIPGQVTLAQWMISEGQAESFAVEVYGEDMAGYYVTDFNEDDLALSKQLIRDVLHVTDFNDMRSYIFGKALSAKWGGEPRQDIPAFAGYAIGYRVVQEYLRRTGKSAVEATFVPCDEIISASRFFE